MNETTLKTLGIRKTNKQKTHDPKKKQKTNVVRSNIAAILLPR